MLYHIFKYLEETMNMPGAGLFQFLTFRAALAILLSLVVSMIFGKKNNKQVKETSDW